MENKFTLSHTTLYAKGWYKTTEDIWEDLRSVLRLDNYTPYTNSDIVSILVNRYNDFNQNIKLINIINDIHPSNCWKYGYYWKENGKEYDMYTAVVYVILSKLRDLDNNQWIIKTPKYTKLQRNPKIDLKTVIERFNYKKI